MDKRTDSSFHTKYSNSGVTKAKRRILAGVIRHSMRLKVKLSRYRPGWALGVPEG
jgi:hypothetical protein